MLNKNKTHFFIDLYCLYIVYAVYACLPKAVCINDNIRTMLEIKIAKKNLAFSGLFGTEEAAC
jgi:hypothetical protein